MKDVLAEILDLCLYLDKKAEQIYGISPTTAGQES